MINDVIHIILRIDCDIYRNIYSYVESVLVYSLSHDNGVKSNRVYQK